MGYLTGLPLPEVFRNYLRQTYGGFLQVGMHKGKSYKYVIKNDPSYAEWCANIPEPSPPLIAFANYISNYKREDSDEESENIPPKKARKTFQKKTASDDECRICMDRQKNACLVPCGHTLCLKCAKRFDDRECPFCKKIVSLSVETF